KYNVTRTPKPPGDLGALAVQIPLTGVEMSELDAQKSTWRTKVGLAEMLKGGVIMDVVTAEQAVIAEEAGAVAVMALERVPADIRAHGGVGRMSDPRVVKEIVKAVRSHLIATEGNAHI